MTRSTLPRDSAPGRLVDQLCDEFEKGRRDGLTHSIEEFIREAPESVRAELFKYLLRIEREHREKAGQPLSGDEARSRFGTLGPWVTEILGEMFLSTGTQVQSSPNPLSDATKARPGERPFSIGRFTIQKLLGRGGMGSVYLARDPQTDRNVAIKVMLPDLAMNPDAKARFLREAKAGAKIDHDNVVPIWHVDEDADAAKTPFIVMPHLRGVSLEDYLVKNPKPSPSLALRIFRDVCQGLAAAHALNLVHRDIKPSNIWLDAEPNRAAAPRFRRAKVLDFGLARTVEGKDGMTRSGAVLGTPEYMSPEQANGSTVDGRSDLFSLGIVLYRMLGGLTQSPFRRENLRAIFNAIAAEDLPPLGAVSAEANAFLAKLLTKDPTVRFQSAADAIDALKFLTKPTPVAGAESVESQVMDANGHEADKTGEFLDITSDSVPSLGIGGISTMNASKTVPVSACRRGTPRKFRPIALFGVVATIGLAVGASGFFKVKTANGTIVVENFPADGEFEVNGEKVSFTHEGETVTLTALKDGKYRLKVTQGGKELTLNEAEVTLAGKAVRVRVETRTESVPPPADVVKDPSTGTPGQPEERFDLSREPMILYDLRLQMNKKTPVTHQLRSDGWIIGPAGTRRGLWALSPTGRRLVLWIDSNDPRARNGQWIDDIGSSNGVDFEGTNNDTAAPPRIRGQLTAAEGAVRSPARQKALAAAFKFDGIWNCRDLSGYKGVRTVNGDVVDTLGAKCSWKQEGDTITVTWPTGGETKLTIVGPDALAGENTSGDPVVWVR